jgi:hypothetical protein
VTHTGQRTGLVRQLHDPSAVNMAKVVGVFGLHQLSNVDA